MEKTDTVEIYIDILNEINSGSRNMLGGDDLTHIIILGLHEMLRLRHEKLVSEEKSKL